MSRAELAAAVSNAGCLGIITSAFYESKEAFREEVRKTKRLTDKPFGVNLNLFPSSHPIDNEDIIDVVIEEGVSFIESSGGSPKPFLKRLHENGVKVIHKVTTLKLARRVEELGCDMVTIVTYGGGGHPGLEEVAPGVIIPAATKTMKVPIIAAGGIADGSGMLAALAMGASGICMGTRFMATQESPLHPSIKEWMLQANYGDTVIIDKALGTARRVIRNSIAERVLGMQALNTKIEDQLCLMGGEVSKGLWQDGNMMCGVLCCGQSVTLVEDITSVSEFVERMVSEARAGLKRLNQCLDN